VSTDEQAESGLGLAAQEAACRHSAARLGLELVSVHADEAVSSVDPIDERPGLLEAIASLTKGDVLVVAKRDRLGRDPIVVAMIEAAVRRRGAPASIVSPGSAGAIRRSSSFGDSFMAVPRPKTLPVRQGGLHPKFFGRAERRRYGCACCPSLERAAVGLPGCGRLESGWMIR
jgi:hypothetical protein